MPPIGLGKYRHTSIEISKNSELLVILYLYWDLEKFRPPFCSGFAILTGGPLPFSVWEVREKLLRTDARSDGADCCIKERRN